MLVAPFAGQRVRHHLETAWLDLATALLTQPVPSVVEAGECVIDQRDFVAGGIPNTGQYFIVLALNRLIAEVCYQGLVLPAQITVDALATMQEITAPGQQLTPDLFDVAMLC
ncbi:MAG TPA: hypothetical protein VIT67_00260 [Povalibacter sp.]